MTAPAPVPDDTTPPKAVLAAAVQDALDAIGCELTMSDCEVAAAAVVAALRLPERDRETAARFRVAAELTIQDVRAQRGDHIAGLVEDSFAEHFARASALREGWES
jgi:hypothetical protein